MRPLLYALGIALALLPIGPAHAQDFFRSSPGPLGVGHADLDNSNGCKSCHQSGGGVTAQLCLTCHEKLAEQIRAKEGLHSTFTQTCLQCHSEHRGRHATVTDWSTIGGEKSFDHARTQFPLAGRHEAVPCTACHKKRLKSGFPSYMGMEPVCTSCHGNRHRFTNRQLLNDCRSCHVPGVARPMRADELPFSHAEVTGIALVHEHGKAACSRCHRGAVMAMPKDGPRTCFDCHKTPHGPTFKAWPCTDCHDVDRPWQKSRFDHDKTRMHLRGAHAKVTCSRCHLSRQVVPQITCASCHKDPHRGRFSDRACESCHALGGTEQMKFEHATQTEFALTGKHANLPCRGCHRGKSPTAFERFEWEGNCMSCHRHANAHNGQFQGKRCLDCHSEGGSRKLDFDHNTDARFPLEGAHAALGAAKQCDKCHSGGNYRTGKINCIDCHRKDDKHEGRLGTDCATCHRPEKGAPKFSHDVHTEFPRTGKHLEVQCGYCHRSPLAGPPPAVGWTKQVEAGQVDLKFPVMGKRCVECHHDNHEGRYGQICDSCHRPTSFADVRSGVHDTGAFRLEGVHDTMPCAQCHTPNRELKGLGESCQLCHRDDDAHANALGPYCGSCHRQIAWVPAQFNHATTGFALFGRHRLTPCNDCHGLGVYGGTTTDCIDCHFGDAAAVRDPVHTAEFPECWNCHTEVSFVPARNHHPWFELVGQHRFAGCSSCHAGALYAGTPAVCEACHLSSYLDPRTLPDHRALNYPTSCADCHTPAGWRPARQP